MAQNEKINKGNIEVVVLFGDKYEIVNKSVQQLGGTLEDLGYGFGIVTVKASDIRKISQLEGVQYIELPKVLFTSDFDSNKACCVPSAWDRYGVSGEGVLVGFIDTGIDFTHPAFKDEAGNTRIDFIYDLGEEKKVYTKAQIDEALKSPNPYSVVNVRDPLGHGTHVAGIACGGGPIPKQNYGVAFKSSIAMVKTTREGFLNFALSTQIMRGIKFLVDKSNELNKPLAINISLSTNDGAHNGTSLLEQYIETICRLERVAIVVASGNEGEAAHHVGGELNELNIIPISVSDSEPALALQLYKPLLVELSIEIINPLGQRSGEIVISEGYRELNIGIDKCIIYNTGPKPFDINGEISISLLPTSDFLSAGEWKINLKVLNNYRGIYDMWLPISETLNPKTRFLQPSVYNTLGIPATVQSVISVGSYNYMTNTFSAFSGRGKLYKTSFTKPDVVAPGEDILSAVPGGNFDTKTGTSMAAPHVTGICALLLEWGIVKGKDPFLYGDRLKYYLSKGAKRSRTEITYPDPSWGFGTVCTYDTLELLKLANVRSEELENIQEEKSQRQKINYVFVEYEGDIVTPVSKMTNVKVYVIDTDRAILVTYDRDMNEVIEELGSIIFYVSPGAIFTLCDITPVDASGANTFYNNIYLPLDGSGVVVGIIDTGIDYLNEEFINKDGTTRIISIFDQTLETGKKLSDQAFGSEFSSEDINTAIQAKNAGKDPYAIVPSKDEIGHGTHVASVVGARGVNPQVLGAAPRCEFSVVKLRNIDENLKDEFCVYGDAPAYSNVALFLALKYLFDLSRKIQKPMVIFIPLGTNMSAHNGDSSVERYINEISKVKGIVVVTPVGNEGEANTHTSGTIAKQGDIVGIELAIGKNQKNLRFDIWVTKPDKIALSIVSPSGEIVDRIPPRITQVTEINFIYEGTKMFIKYYIPDERTGDERISIIARNIREGVWIFNLIGDLVSIGTYNAWLPQREILDPETRFIIADPYVTLTTPSVAREAISVSYYNQTNNATVGASGRGYTSNGQIKPEIAAGGINAITTAVGGGTKLVSGSSIAGAVVAGCSALILQWGIVNGNDRGMYATKVKTYLIRGTYKREGDTYPNPLWGYGAIDMRGVFNNIRALGDEGSREISSSKSKNIFISPQNRNVLVEYKGDIVKAMSKYHNSSVYIIDEKRALVSVPYINDREILQAIPEIIYADPGAVLTLSDITPTEASEATLFHNNIYLPLDGSGIIVGIPDTGIDYLNEEFINEDGTSRILNIWDQTIEGEALPKGLPAGSIYTQEDINRALLAKKNGQDPYEIVPTKDELGHGTNLAGIIAARGVNPKLIGVAPKCDLAVVKLREGTQSFRDYYAIYGDTIAYKNVALFLAIKYLYELANELKKPIVICIGMGSNNGSHNGESFEERYLDEIATFNGIIPVVATGNQGNSNTHTSGVIKNQDDIAIIELKIGEKQKDIRMEIWISKPDKVALSVTSPTGEVIRRVPPKLKEVTDVTFIYEETRMTIEYFIPEEITGDQKIVIVARNIREGIWQFKLIGDFIVVGRYDAWILQKELLAPGTMFLNASPYTTLTLPSTSSRSISVAYYNQNNNAIVPQSGRGYTKDNMIKPDIAAGGINAITTEPGGGTKIVSGSSVAAAIVAGCCALILQWGFVEGNDVSMYASKVKTYLIRGTNKRAGDIYPNPQWGYGMLDMKGVFDNIRIFGKETEKKDGSFQLDESSYDEYYIGNLYIRMPRDNHIRLW